MTSNASTATKKPAQVYAVSAIRRMIDADQDAAVTAGLESLRQYEPDSVANMSDALLAPWLGAVAETGAAVPELVASLHERRPWLVIDAADRLAESDSKPKAQVRREFFVASIHRAQKEAAA